MHLASMLGYRFSIVTVLSRLVPLFENLSRVYGVADKLSSVRSVEIPVLELEKDADRLLRSLVEQSANCIVEDAAHVIVFGCTGMLGYARRVQDGLERLGHEGIPVIDPLPTAVRMAEVLVDLRLSHSKQTYPKPSSKWVEDFDFHSC
jgi:allantoin racemase